MTCTDLMSREEVAALLNINAESVRSTLRRQGITEQRGYPRDEVLSRFKFLEEPPVGTSIRMASGRTFTRHDHHPDFHWKDSAGWYRWSEVRGRGRREHGEVVAADVAGTSDSPQSTKP